MKLPNQRLKLPNAPVYQRRIFAAAADLKRPMVSFIFLFWTGFFGRQAGKQA